MPIAFSPEDRKAAIASIIRFCDAELEVELSQIQATALLEYFLKELAPTAYNAGVADAQTFLRDRLGDLEATVHEGEFTYWPKGSSVRRKQ
jgi:uncharacterized protein (DUF2164 family)